jgi:transposase
LRHAATRKGGEATDIDPALTTRRHHQCGHQLPADVNTARHPIVSCPRCDVTFDQDANAVANMLREWAATTASYQGELAA